MRISDWSSDVCSSDLGGHLDLVAARGDQFAGNAGVQHRPPRLEGLDQIGDEPGRDCIAACAVRGGLGTMLAEQGTIGVIERGEAATQIFVEGMIIGALLAAAARRRMTIDSVRPLPCARSVESRGGTDWSGGVNEG